jgi:ATP-dependent Clp protease ATP-binding subunit ClpA
MPGLIAALASSAYIDETCLALSLREAQALNDTYIGVQHLALALLARKDGMAPVILSALGTPAASLRSAVLARYRKAS